MTLFRSFLKFTARFFLLLTAFDRTAWRPVTGALADADAPAAVDVVAALGALLVAPAFVVFVVAATTGVSVVLFVSSSSTSNEYAAGWVGAALILKRDSDTTYSTQQTSQECVPDEQRQRYSREPSTLAFGYVYINTRSHSAAYPMSW
jgi:hypothetical protein